MIDDRKSAPQNVDPTRRTLIQASGALTLAAMTGGVLLPRRSDAAHDNGGSLMAEDEITVAVMIFDGITQLDATAPLEVLAGAGLSVVTVAPEKRLVVAGSGLKLMPDHDFKSAPDADILLVPGGAGVNALLTDKPTLAFLRRAAGAASYVTSVCTGALLLGAAGLLRGKRATTHWASHHFLKSFGAVPVHDRVVMDGNIITGGGVTAGVDFGFAVVERVRGREAAALTMLALEYDPAPPFKGGTPAKTDPSVVATYQGYAKRFLADRANQVALAASRL